MVFNLAKMDVERRTPIKIFYIEKEIQMKRSFLLILCFILVGYYQCTYSQKSTTKKKITIGLIGKMANNPVFIASHTGALVAAKELGQKYGADVTIIWKTPDKENVEEQASAIKEFIRMGVNGIAIACTDANYLTNTIDAAVNKGIPVMCFDSDAPKSKRFAYYGANDNEFGRTLVKEMANILNNKGKIAVLAGNKVALNLQRRLQGIKDELRNYPNIILPTDYIIHNIDIPDIASATVERVQRRHPDINGWIFVTSAPLLIKNSLKWNPGEIKVVAGQAVPAQLEYVKNGYVQSLVGMNCFLLGYKSVEILLDKVLYNKVPKNPLVYAPLIPVTKSNMDEWSMNWKKWLVKEAAYK